MEPGLQLFQLRLRPVVISQSLPNGLDSELDARQPHEIGNQKGLILQRITEVKDQLYVLHSLVTLAGGEFRAYRSDGYNHLFARGQATFQGLFTGQPLADLLLGLPSLTLLGVNDNRQALRTWSVHSFMQDDWRVTARLTVNAGLRYEFNARPYDADDRMRIFDLTTLQLRQVGADGVSRSGLHADDNDVAPRVGVSWDLTGSGRWLLRGGYGIFYDSGTLIENSALYFNPPFFSLQLFFPGSRRENSMSDIRATSPEPR